MTSAGISPPSTSADISPGGGGDMFPIYRPLCMVDSCHHVCHGCAQTSLLKMN
jgi:hypothetical protein